MKELTGPSKTHLLEVKLGVILHSLWLQWGWELLFGHEDSLPPKHLCLSLCNSSLSMKLIGAALAKTVACNLASSQGICQCYWWSVQKSCLPQNDVVSPKLSISLRGLISHAVATSPQYVELSQLGAVSTLKKINPVCLLVSALFSLLVWSHHLHQQTFIQFNC